MNLAGCPRDDLYFVLLLKNLDVGLGLLISYVQLSSREAFRATLTLKRPHDVFECRYVMLARLEYSCDVVKRPTEDATQCCGSLEENSVLRSRFGVFDV